MPNQTLNDLFSQALGVDCDVTVENGRFNIKFIKPEQIPEGSFSKVCKEFLFEYGIEVIDPQSEQSSNSATEIQINESEEFEKKLDYLKQVMKLHEAARSGSLQTLRELLHQGVYVNVTNINGETPLMSAVYAAPYSKEATEAIKFLLREKANVNIETHGRTVFDIAYEVGAFEVIKLLEDSKQELPVEEIVTVEEATGRTAVEQVGQGPGNDGFFSPPRKPIGEETQAEVKPAAANLGK